MIAALQDPERWAKVAAETVVARRDEPAVADQGNGKPHRQAVSSSWGPRPSHPQSGGRAQVAYNPKPPLGKSAVSSEDPDRRTPLVTPKKDFVDYLELRVPQLAAEQPKKSFVHYQIAFVLCVLIVAGLVVYEALSNSTSSQPAGVQTETSISTPLQTVPASYFQMSMVSEAPSADSRKMVLSDKSSSRQDVLNVGKTPVLDLTGVKSAEVGSADHRFSIRITLTEEAGRRIFAVTRQNIGKRVAFIIDGKVFFAPVIREPFSDRLEISGNFTEPEAKEIVSKINASVAGFRR
jgi:hypothetical protein